jgi:hypothetical protein
VPFSKSKPGRGPLQRLSDQRRSLALAGLAAGAVLGGAIFRRRRRGVRDELLAPVPGVERPVAPGTQGDFGPPAAVEVPPAASEPETAEPLPEAVDTGDSTDASATGADSTAGAEATIGTADGAETDGDTPINAGTAATDGAAVDEAPAGADPSTDEPSPPAEGATGELNAEEASILAVLAQNGRADEDRTALAVATSLERETTDVAAVLRKLSSEGVVSGDLYTAGGDKIWAVTERGVRRLGAQH